MAEIDADARALAQIRVVIDGARTLDQLGDGERCNSLADGLDRTLARLEASDGAGS